jgi:hypothetical protein
LAVSSLTSSTSSNEALALQAELARDAVKAQLAGDIIGAQIARKSARFVAWMDSTPDDELLIELFGYSAHVFARNDYERRAGQALCRGRKYVPPPARGQAPKIEALVANSAPPAENSAPRLRKSRRPTLTSVSKQASRAGIEVARYEIKPDGTVVVVTGKSEATEPNPWLDDLKVTKQ